jgi:phosphotransferase system  glucose/maltose/N-acetylglucosamine-specific IIC component
MAGNEDEQEVARTTVEALLVHASTEALGEAVSWEVVEALIVQLMDETFRARHLREALARLNDASVAAVLSDWMWRYATERRREAAEARRVSDRLATPAQRMFAGLSTAAIFGLVIGTVSGGWGALLTGIFVAGFAGSSFAGYKVSGRHDRRDADANDIDLLREIVDARLERLNGSSA